MHPVSQLFSIFLSKIEIDFRPNKKTLYSNARERVYIIIDRDRVFTGMHAPLFHSFLVFFSQKSTIAFSPKYTVMQESIPLSV